MGVALYVHIPFCKSKCFYCSFSSFEQKDHLVDPYLEALKKEASGYRGALVDTVYVGGGTPTILNLGQLKALFLLVYENFIVQKEAEITLEINPATFDLEKASALKEIGVNRASLGVQSLNDKHLELLGRSHSSMEAYAAFDMLRRAGFGNINVDLIYSLPGQTDEEIAADVEKLSALASEHLSLYTLTLAEDAQLFARRDGLPNDERQAAQYLLVKDILEKKRFVHYEVSNFAKKGFECRHNLLYWQGGNYIGLGAAAHSHLQGHRFWNVAEPEKFIERIRQAGTGQEGEEWLEPEAQLMEAVLIGLRVSEGVDLEEMESRHATPIPAEKRLLLEEMVASGLLRRESGRLKTTAQGLLILDEICARLI